MLPLVQNSATLLCLVASGVINTICKNDSPDYGPTDEGIFGFVCARWLQSANLNSTNVKDKEPEEVKAGERNPIPEYLTLLFSQFQN